MKPYILSIVLSIFFSLSLSAQSSNSYKWGGLGYASVGFQKINFDVSISPIVNNPIYRDNFNFQFGGGGFLLLGSKYIIKGYGFGSVYESNASDNKSVRPTIGGGGINLGYAILNNNNFLLFPTIGIGANGYNIEIQNNSQTSFDFGNEVILSNETENFQLAYSYLDVNLNFHKLLDIGLDDGDTSGISLGLSCGFQLPINEGSWSNLANESELQNLDSNAASTFYIRLLVGGGGFAY